MKKVNCLNKSVLTFLFLFNLQQLFAQAKVEVNGHDVGSWFSTHWVWIAGFIILLVILLLATTGGSKRKSTTIVKDANGNIKHITTVENKDN